MTTVFLNGEFMPAEEAKISPMDRGFLFGDGLYEVIPTFAGKMVGFERHVKRLNSGLAAIELELNWDLSKWRKIINQLLSQNGSGYLSVYIHVTRGAPVKRNHAFPAEIEPTVFMRCFDIPATLSQSQIDNPDTVKGFRVCSQEDMRWKRCNIKTTSLLGNVLHFQHAKDQKVDEILLYNQDNELTEASTCNVFIVKENRVFTPPLDNQILPGITRSVLIDILHENTEIKVEEVKIPMDWVESADEIWITSSTKEVGPVVELNGKPVGQSKPGKVWQIAQSAFCQHKFSY